MASQRKFYLIWWRFNAREFTNLVLEHETFEWIAPEVRGVVVRSVVDKQFVKSLFRQLTEAEAGNFLRRYGLDKKRLRQRDFQQNAEMSEQDVFEWLILAIRSELDGYPVLPPNRDHAHQFTTT